MQRQARQRLKHLKPIQKPAKPTLQPVLQKRQTVKRMRRHQKQTAKQASRQQQRVQQRRQPLKQMRRIAQQQRLKAKKMPLIIPLQQVTHTLLLLTTFSVRSLMAPIRQEFFGIGFQRVRAMVKQSMTDCAVLQTWRQELGQTKLTRCARTILMFRPAAR
jgi:hypothetical protein